MMQNLAYRRALWLGLLLLIVPAAHAQEPSQKAVEAFFDEDWRIIKNQESRDIDRRAAIEDLERAVLRMPGLVKLLATKGLQDPDEVARLAAVQVLGRTRLLNRTWPAIQEVTMPLLAALNDASPKVRERVAGCLGHLYQRDRPPVAVVEALASRLRTDGSPEVR